MLFLTFLGLSAICAVQSAGVPKTKCYEGSAEDKKEVVCGEGVTQCTKTNAEGSGLGISKSTTKYGCSLLTTEKPVGCNAEEKSSDTKVEALDLDLSAKVKMEVCYCTGSLCNSAPSNRFSFIMAFSCFMMACLRFSF